MITVTDSGLATLRGNGAYDTPVVITATITEHSILNFPAHSFEILNKILSDGVLVVKIVSARVLVVKSLHRTLFPQE